MKITKTGTTYRVEHEGRTIRAHVFHDLGLTHFDEDAMVTLPSGRTVTDAVPVLRLDRCVAEGDIERVLAEALA